MSDDSELSKQAECARACFEKEGEPSIVRASEIQQLHSEIMGALRQTVDKAIRIGELLTEQKAECEHGEWLPWLEENVGFSHDTARNYIKLSEHRENEELRNVRNLTEAYRAIGLLGDGGKETNEQPEPEPHTEPENPQTEQEVVPEQEEAEEPEQDVIDAEYTELETESEVVEDCENSVGEQNVKHTEDGNKHSRVQGLVYEEERVAVSDLKLAVHKHIQKVKKVRRNLGLSEQSLDTIRELATLLSKLGATNE